MKKVYTFLFIVLLPFILIANNLDNSFLSIPTETGDRSIITADFNAVALNIDENINTPNIKVYPNPVSQQLNIVLENDDILKGEALNLNLFNTSGNIVIQKKVTANQSVISLDLATLPPGEYTLLLVNPNFKFTQKVIKK